MQSLESIGLLDFNFFHQVSVCFLGLNYVIFIQGRPLSLVFRKVIIDCREHEKSDDDITYLL